ncbi:MAG: hypothetical protein LBC27_07825 [Spirochaetaceae bacterium]|nr:hypothetical protein [Spirochaetaceae bacterium]
MHLANPFTRIVNFNCDGALSLWFAGHPSDICGIPLSQPVLLQPEA